MALALARASSAPRATLTPPPLPRPPAWICALTTTTSEPVSRWMAAIASSASASESAGRPLGTATPRRRRSSLAWYSWIFKLVLRSLRCVAGAVFAARVLSRRRRPHNAKARAALLPWRGEPPDEIAGGTVVVGVPGDRLDGVAHARGGAGAARAGGGGAGAGARRGGGGSAGRAAGRAGRGAAGGRGPGAARVGAAGARGGRVAARRRRGDRRGGGRRAAAAARGRAGRRRGLRGGARRGGGDRA